MASSSGKLAPHRKLGEEGSYGHFTLDKTTASAAARHAGRTCFTWTPTFAARAQSLDTPQTLAPPLKRRRTLEERSLVFRDERLLGEFQPPDADSQP